MKEVFDKTVLGEEFEKLFAVKLLIRVCTAKMSGSVDDDKLFGGTAPGMVSYGILHVI